MQTYTITTHDVYGHDYPVVPITHKATGAFCIPKVGQVFLGAKGEVCILEKGDVAPKGPRLILAAIKAITPEVVYGCDPPAPEGYVKKYFRKTVKGDVIISNRSKKALEIKNPDLHGYRWILQPAPKPPTPAEVYGKDVDAPVGWEKIRFDIPKEGDWYIGQPAANNWEKYKPVVMQYDGCTIPCLNALPQRWIVRKAPVTPTPLSVYGTDTPTPPKGFVLGEFRKLVREEIVNWLCAKTDTLCPSTGFCTHVYANAGTYRYTLLSIPPKPTINGWEAVEYRQPVKGDSYKYKELPGFHDGTIGINIPTHNPAQKRWILRKLPTRWLIEVESEKEPSMNQYGDWLALSSKAKLISVTRKSV